MITFARGAEQVEIGLARIMHNYGRWDGSHNCIFKSLQNLLLLSPRKLRSLLVEHITVMTPEQRLPYALSVLPETATRLPPIADIHTACIKRISSDGFIPADLLISFLNEMLETGSLDKILKRSYSVAFLQEDPSQSYALTHSTLVFRHLSA